MTMDPSRFIHGVVVEEEVRFPLVELCRTRRVSESDVRAWVIEGLLEPEGEQPEEWRFGGPSLRRARAAVRLSRDLGVNLSGIALAPDLLDEIAALRSRLGGLRAPNDPLHPLWLE